MNCLLLAAAWALWCAVHSGMISPTVTEFLRRRLGRGYRFYRLFFNLTAAATLVPVVLFARSVQGPILFRWDGAMAWPRYFLLTGSGLLFLAGARHYDMLQFLGLRQITTGRAHGPLSESGRIVTTGVMGLVRHPWYLAAILLVWTADRTIDVPALVTNVVLTAYLIVGTLLEERKLVGQFGGEYRLYRQQVPMLVPRPWKRRVPLRQDGTDGQDGGP